VILGWRLKVAHYSPFVTLPDVTRGHGQHTIVGGRGATSARSSRSSDDTPLPDPPVAPPPCRAPWAACNFGSPVLTLKLHDLPPTSPCPSAKCLMEIPLRFSARRSFAPGSRDAPVSPTSAYPAPWSRLHSRPPLTHQRQDGIRLPTAAKLDDQLARAA